MRTRTIVILPFLLAVLAFAGCASSGGGGSSGRSSSDIDRAELLEVSNSTQNLYEAIRRLRPFWLRPRTTGISGERYFPIIYVSGARYGPVGTLREMRPGNVERVRFMDPSQATNRYGTGHTGGAILVTLLR